MFSTSVESRPPQTNLCDSPPHVYSFRNSSASFAIFAAIRRASSLLSSLATDLRSGSSQLPAENDDARADGFCAPTKNSTGFEIFDNDRETKSIVQRLSNPMMLFRDITKVNSTMVIGHGVITFRIGVLADEFKCFARSKVFIGITAAINSGGRFIA